MISTNAAILFFAGAVLLFAPNVFLRDEWKAHQFVKILSDNNKLVAVICISAGLYLSMDSPKPKAQPLVQLTDSSVGSMSASTSTVPSSIDTSS